MLDLDADFKKYFPKCPFILREGQKKVINNIVMQDNTLCIMQTGGGKSVVYWMSALELQGISLVISPLTALIAEQAEKIREQGYEVMELHGNISAKKQMKLLKQFANGEIAPKFIFVSPEKIATDGFFEYCLKQRKDDIKLIVIDEVHCVSQWGVSFRPFYKRIPQFLTNMYGDNWPIILALTATLNPKELGDVCSEFKIEKKNILKQELLMRSEIQLHVQKFHNEDEKTEKFWRILQVHSDEKILVYVYRKYAKRSVEDLCQKAVEKGFKAVSFHGDMTANERLEIIQQFKDNKVNIVFATNAFGMGIDIPDIRVVIHFLIPDSLEQYYQEVGRAARDGQGANAYLLYTDKNVDVKRKFFINASFPSEDKLRAVYKKIARKIGLIPLAYFDDDEIQQCLPYYLQAGLIEIVDKGFADLKSLRDVKDSLLEKYMDSSKTKNFIIILKNNNITTVELSELVYADLVNDKATTDKALDKRLIISVKTIEILDNVMAKMLKNIVEKKQYKNELMDYLIYVIENNIDSQHLHQEIAYYLGTDKHVLNRIYKAEDGNQVRSKSEVIICNLLYRAGISYQYEQKLYYGQQGKYIEPDFTIIQKDGTEVYWEHVGMLGKEDYDKRWLGKIEIYNKHFPGKMIKTYESGNLSQDARNLIRQLE